MKPLRLLIISSFALLALFAFSAGSASADARTDCAGVDAEDSGSNAAALRAAVICLTNRERIARGMGALKENRALDSAAQSHSEDMAQNKYFAHVDQSGGQPGDRTRKSGYANGYVGENIAAGYASPFLVMVGWMQSSGHCSNILSAKYKEIGIGIATKADSEYGIYWTMVLGGNDASAPKVTIRCPYDDLVPGAVAGANTLGTGAAPIKPKVTLAKRLKDGRYRIEGKTTPGVKGTVVNITVRRGLKTRKYTVKTKKSGLFVKTVRVPSGTVKFKISVWI